MKSNQGQKGRDEEGTKSQNTMKSKGDETKQNEQLPPGKDKQVDKPQSTNVAPDNTKTEPALPLPEQSESFLDVGRRGPIHADVNRLIYVPKQCEIKTEKLLDRSTGRFLDYTFLISNFITLILSIYHLLLGLTILSFISSIHSILDHDLKNDDIVTSKGQPIPPPLDDDGDNAHAVLHTIPKQSPSTISLILIIGAFIQDLNVFCAIYAVVQGFKNLLMLHAIIFIACFFGVSVSSVILTRESRCDAGEIGQVQDALLGYIRIYETPKNAKEREEHEIAEFQLDSIQIGLSCCGALSWADYLNPLILQDGNSASVLPEHIDVEGVETVFPSSCCRSWWVRNVHCSRGVHLWAHPAVDEKTAYNFRQRINQAGCMWRIKRGCDRLLAMTVDGLRICAIIDFILIIIKLACIYKIEKVMATIIQKKKEYIANDLGHTEAIDQESPDGFRSPLPTEDEIETIKARTDFNKFEARVKRTKIGKWMKQARKSVYMSFDSRGSKTLKAVRSKDHTTDHANKTKEAESDEDEEHFLDAEQVLKLEIEKQMQRAQERKFREHTRTLIKERAIISSMNAKKKKKRESKSFNSKDIEESDKL